jgi:hypothetical protein
MGPISPVHPLVIIIVLRLLHVRPGESAASTMRGRFMMTRGLIVLVTAATMSAAVLPAPAQAGGRGGAVAAGLIGGLAAGAIIGGALAQPRYAEPVYVAPPPPRCYWTRGEPVWDDYRGVWRRPRMQICD